MKIFVLRIDFVAKLMYNYCIILSYGSVAA